MTISYNPPVLSGTTDVPDLQADLSWTSATPMGGDPDFADVVLLLHCDGANGGTSFPDSSSIANTVTASNGGVTETSVVKFGTAAMAVLGTGLRSGVTVPYSSNFDFSTGDWTIEFWGYSGDWANASSGQILIQEFAFTTVFPYRITIDSSGHLNLDCADSSGIAQVALAGATVLSVNTWQFFAVQRSGSAFAIYVDGVLDASSTYAGSLGSNSANPFIGGTAGSAGTFLDEIRFTKGVARYSANFTPPTAAFPDSGAPSGPPPAYNVYRDDVGLIASLDNSPTEILAYVDTVPGAGTYTYTVTAAGAGSSDVSLQLDMDGSNGSTTFTDLSLNALTVTASGGAEVTTSNPKFGTGSLVGASTNNLSVPITTGGPLDLSTGPFTIEFWANTSVPTSSTSQILIGCRDSGNGSGIVIGYRGDTGVLNAQMFGSGIGTVTVTPWTAGTWHAVAMVYDGSFITVYVDGIAGSPNSTTTPAPFAAPNFQIGADVFSSITGNYWLGQIDEVRVTQAALYTANYTPVSAAFPIPGGSHADISDPSNPYVAVFGTPPPTGVVPSVVNTSLAVVAPGILTAAGFVVGAVAYEASGVIIVGNIIRQSPAAGTTALLGTAVNVVVSSGLPPLTVPDIYGLSEADAILALTNLGLVVGAVSSAPSQFVPPGTVQLQNPSAGTPVAVGSIVSFVLSLGNPAVGTKFDFEATVISQYANSPVILQLAQNMNDYVDQSANFANFYNFVWNVDTAVGFGLDIWGKIVGVARLLRIPNTTDYVGFDNSATPPPDWQTMGSTQTPGGPVGGAMYTGYNATEAYLLDDNAYRQLILAKAFANICTTTAPAINTILQNLYGPGTAWVLNDGVMAISYNLSFTPSAIQLAILEQSGVIPTPPGVSVTINTNV